MNQQRYDVRIARAPENCMVQRSREAGYDSSRTRHMIKELGYTHVYNRQSDSTHDRSSLDTEKDTSCVASSCPAIISRQMACVATVETRLPTHFADNLVP